jgi:hypothetical protein
MKVIGKISGKNIQEGETNEKQWKRAVFVIDDKKYSTFDIKIIDGFIPGDNVDLDYEQSGMYKNIKSIVKTQASFNTADQVQDPSIWVKKDMRQAKMNGLNNATAIIEVMSKVEPEKLKEELTKAKSYILLAEDIARQFMEFIYEEGDEPYPKIDSEFPDY